MPLRLRPLAIWLPLAALLSVTAMANVLSGYRLEGVLAGLLWVICAAVPASFATCWQVRDARVAGNRIIEATVLSECMLLVTLLYAGTHTNPEVYDWGKTMLLFLALFIPLLILSAIGTVIRKAKLLTALPHAKLAAVWTVAFVPLLLHGLFVLRQLVAPW